MKEIEKAIEKIKSARAHARQYDRHYSLRELGEIVELQLTEALRELQAVNQTGVENIEIGDIVQFFAASHPLNEPTEYIGRVERDYKGLHAANRYLPITGVRIIEKGT